MKLLELFCGTKSVGKVAEKLDIDTVSLDILPKFNPDVCCNIMDFDYTAYPKGHFDFIWASPPCTEFSVAKTTGVRDLEGAIKVVEQTLKMIEYLEPKYFCIENPVGLLRRQECMIPFKQYETVVSYCKYGFAYRKNTNFWTNVKYNPRRCLKGNYCEAKEKTGRHMVSVQNGDHYKNGVKTNQPGVYNLNDRYAIPEAVIYDILSPALS